MAKPGTVKIVPPTDPECKGIVVTKEGEVFGLTTENSVPGIYHIAVKRYGLKWYTKKRYEEMVRLAKALGIAQEGQGAQPTPTRRKGRAKEAEA